MGNAGQLQTLWVLLLLSRCCAQALVKLLSPQHACLPVYLSPEFQSNGRSQVDLTRGLCRRGQHRCPWIWIAGILQGGHLRLLKKCCYSCKLCLSMLVASMSLSPSVDVSAGRENWSPLPAAGFFFQLCLGGTVLRFGLSAAELVVILFGMPCIMSVRCEKRLPFGFRLGKSCTQSLDHCCGVTLDVCMEAS